MIPEISCLERRPTDGTRAENGVLEPHLSNVDGSFTYVTAPNEPKYMPNMDPAKHSGSSKYPAYG